MSGTQDEVPLPTVPAAIDHDRRRERERRLDAAAGLNAVVGLAGTFCGLAGLTNAFAGHTLLTIQILLVAFTVVPVTLLVLGVLMNTDWSFSPRPSPMLPLMAACVSAVWIAACVGSVLAAASGLAPAAFAPFAMMGPLAVIGVALLALNLRAWRVTLSAIDDPS